MAGVNSLVEAYHALGLPERKVKTIPYEATREGIEEKITNPKILQNQGLDEILLKACYHVEFAANLLDSFAETGRESFLVEADEEYEKFLNLIPKDSRDRMKLIAASALSYFQIEQYFAERIKRGDNISKSEAEFYHLSRGNDAWIYGEILNLANSKKYPGTVSGIRIRQALWDLVDEVKDLDQDKRTLGVNLLLMGGFNSRKNLSEFASRLYKQSEELDISHSLQEAIKKEYERAMDTISSQ